MKAQLSFDYYISLIVFIVFISYLFFQLLNYVPNYFKEVNSQRLRAEAYQVSELLVNDVGQPANWNEDQSNMKRLGLLDRTRGQTNFISLGKITAFQNICSANYADVVKLLGVDDDLKVLFVDKNSEVPLIDCSSPEAPSRIQADIKRTVAYRTSSGELSFGELTVQMW